MVSACPKEGPSIKRATVSTRSAPAGGHGGHLSLSGDPDGGGPVLGWGTGFGSSAISGAPFHFKYILLDGSSVGNRDNQIQPGALVVPTATATGDGTLVST